MSARITAALVLLGLGTHITHADTVLDVRVFTTSFMAVDDQSNRANAIYYLDDVERALASLAKGLPTELSVAEAVTQRRLNTAEGRSTLQQLQTAFDGLVRAWSHDIEKLPAILINDQYVIYGIRDVDEALRLFAESRP